MIHLDTHVVIWLAAREHARLSKAADQVLHAEPRLISPIVELELQYLHERGRLGVSPARLLETLNQDLPYERSMVRVAALVDIATGLGWTRDPFDRLIVANAIADRARLVTIDELIRANFGDAVW